MSYRRDRRDGPHEDDRSTASAAGRAPGRRTRVEQVYGQVVGRGAASAHAEPIDDDVNPWAEPARPANSVRTSWNVDFEAVPLDQPGAKEPRRLPNTGMYVDELKVQPIAPGFTAPTSFKNRLDASATSVYVGDVDQPKGTGGNAAVTAHFAPPPGLNIVLQAEAPDPASDNPYARELWDVWQRAQRTVAADVVAAVTARAMPADAPALQEEITRWLASHPIYGLFPATVKITEAAAAKTAPVRTVKATYGAVDHDKGLVARLKVPVTTRDTVKRTSSDWQSRRASGAGDSRTDEQSTSQSITMEQQKEIIDEVDTKVRNRVKTLWEENKRKLNTTSSHFYAHGSLDLKGRNALKTVNEINGKIPFRVGPVLIELTPKFTSTLEAALEGMLHLDGGYDKNTVEQKIEATKEQVSNTLEVELRNHLTTILRTRLEEHITRSTSTSRTRSLTATQDDRRGGSVDETKIEIVYHPREPQLTIEDE